MRSNNVDGTVALRDRHWCITAKPHVLFRAERALLNSQRHDDGTSILVPASPEGATDVFWFCQRYRLKVENPVRLRGDAAKFAISHGRAEKILAGNFAPAHAGFRPGKTPREYQSQAASLWQATRGLLVADELGLGKTLTGAISLMKPEFRPAVVVAPPHLCGQWQDAIHEFFSGVRTHVIKQMGYYDLPKFRLCSRCNVWSMQKQTHGQAERLGVCRKCQLTLRGEVSGPDIFLCSYTKLHQWADILGQICKSAVFDECHELRREGTKKGEAAKNLSNLVDYRLGLSATPIANLGGEMFNVMNVLSPGSLGSKSDFRKTWCVGYGPAGREPALEEPDAFGEYLRSQHLMIRRTREEVGRELPAHTRVVHKIEADTSQIENIKGRAGDLARLILSGSKIAGEVMNAAGQLESLVRQQTAVAKAPYVAAFVDMILQSGNPVVLFGYHRSFYEIVTSKLRDHNPLMYTGSESQEKKKESKDRFCCGDSNLLIVSLRSGAGLDGLQHRCATGVFGELDWSPAAHSQCLSSDTEVLTKKGWQTKDEICVGDIICGYNPETKAIDWVPVTDKVERPLGEEAMYGMESKRLSVRVTAGHRMLTLRKRRTLDGVYYARGGFMRADCLAETTRRAVPTAGFESVKGIPLTLDECKLVGLLMTDGSFACKGNTLQVHQASHQPWCKEIESILDGCNLRWTVSKRVSMTRFGVSKMNEYRVSRGNVGAMWSQWEIDKVLANPDMTSRQLSGLLPGRNPSAIGKKRRKMRQCGLTATFATREHKFGATGFGRLDAYLKKNPLAMFQEATREQVLALLHGMWLGDGRKLVQGDTRAILKSARALHDDLQSLCVRRGISSVIYSRKMPGDIDERSGCYFTYRPNSDFAVIPSREQFRLKPVEASQDENVWCLTNRLSTLVTRRNGRVAIVGNCEGRYHRDGQKLPCMSYYLVCDYGLDPAMMQVLGVKRAQASGLLQSAKDDAIAKDSHRYIKQLAETYLRAAS